MKKTDFLLRHLAAATLAWTLSPSALASDDLFATTVIDYQRGQTNTDLFNPYAGVDRPGDFSGVGSGFSNIYSVFSPHFTADEVTQIGEGGFLTLRLGCHPPHHWPGSRSWASSRTVGLFDSNFPNGVADGSTFGIDPVFVEVSTDGLTWVSIGEVICDFPAGAFTDAADPFATDSEGLKPTNFSQPHSLQLSDISDKNYAEIRSLLGSSAGGTWIDIDSSNLETVSYVRLSVPDDGDASTNATFELIGLSVSDQTAVDPAGNGVDFAENFTTDPLGTRATSDPGHASYNRHGTRGFLRPQPADSQNQLAARHDADRRRFFHDDNRVLDRRHQLRPKRLWPTFLRPHQLCHHRKHPHQLPEQRLRHLDRRLLPGRRILPPSPRRSSAPSVPARVMPLATSVSHSAAAVKTTALSMTSGEVGQLPTGTSLDCILSYNADSRLVTLQLVGQNINSVGSNMDGDITTIQYTIPERITFEVDSFAILCWQEADGGTATLTFEQISVRTPAPEPNYYSWADANIEEVIERATHLDADGDRLSNLLEYGLGGIAPTYSSSGANIEINWQRDTSRTDVSLNAFTSTDLRDWAPIGDVVTGTNSHTATLPITGDRAFLQLRATRP